LPPPGRRSRLLAGAPTDGTFAREQANELGWLDSETQQARLARAVRVEIVPALAAFGVELSSEVVAALGV
jgi:hypothetical protein